MEVVIVAGRRLIDDLKLGVNIAKIHNWTSKVRAS